jgi:glutathione S-transferase
VSPKLRNNDEVEKKKAREALVASTFPVWGQRAEAQLGEGPFFAGSKVHVVDVKLYMIVRWFAGGKVDHVPPTVFAPHTKLMRLHDAVRDDPRVKGWNAKWM